MAKYEFEWTDEQAQGLQELLSAAADNAPDGRLFFSNVAQRIEEQKPVPLPTKIGAIIRGKVGPGSSERTFVCSGNGWMEDDGDAYTVPPIRTWTVLFEGVDL
jgi:hypothetical protein